MKTFFSILVSVGILISVVRAQVPQHIADSLQNVIELYQGSNSIPGISAAVKIYGIGIWTGTTGASFENTPLSPELLLGIGSNTKTFTATMMLKLWEQGIVSLDDSLHHWLPSFNNIDSNITIKQLLRHNTGIADFWITAYVNAIFSNPDSVWTREDVLNFVGPSLFPAGTNVAYSNTNFTLAGMIMEAATGLEYSILIRDSILDPLNLNNTYLEGFETIIGESAHPWHLGEDVNLIPRTAVTTGAYAAGCIKSTPEDMVNWYDQLFNNDFLSNSGMVEMTDFIDIYGSTINGVGCGIFRMEIDTKTYYLHSGNIRGYSSYTLFDVENKHSISILRNDTFINCEDVAEALARALNVLIITGIEETENNFMVDIYPNPVNDYFTISIESDIIENHQLQLFDFAGKLVYQQQFNSSKDQHSIRIDVSELIKGTYILNLNTNTNSFSQKIVKL